MKRRIKSQREKQGVSNNTVYIQIDKKGNYVEVKAGEFELIPWGNKEWKVKKYYYKDKFTIVDINIEIPEWKLNQIMELQLNGEIVPPVRSKDEMWLVPKKLFLRGKINPRHHNSNYNEISEGLKNSVKWFYRFDKFISKEDVEDAFMDAVANAYEREIKKSEAAIYGHAKVNCYRQYATNRGNLQNGKSPKFGKRAHISNVYDANGNNIVESISDTVELPEWVHSSDIKRGYIYADKAEQEA